MVWVSYSRIPNGHSVRSVVNGSALAARRAGMNDAAKPNARQRKGQYAETQEQRRKHIGYSQQPIAKLIDVLNAKQGEIGIDGPDCLPHGRDQRIRISICLDDDRGLIGKISMERSCVSKERTLIAAPGTPKILSTLLVLSTRVIFVQRRVVVAGCSSWGDG